jgi:hypothetical protein
MAEEERWMRLYLRSVELERERQDFECRMMAMEEALGRRAAEARREQERRRVLQREADERAAMQAEEARSSAANARWKAEAALRREGRRQEQLARSLVRMPPAGQAGGLARGCAAPQACRVEVRGLWVGRQLAARLAAVPGSPLFSAQRRWVEWAQGARLTARPESRSPIRPWKVDLARRSPSRRARGAVLTREQIRVGAMAHTMAIASWRRGGLSAMGA